MSASSMFRLSTLQRFGKVGQSSAAAKMIGRMSLDVNRERGKMRVCLLTIANAFLSDLKSVNQNF